MTTQTAATIAALQDLDRAVIDLTAAQQAAQQRRPPQPPKLTSSIKRNPADVSMCHLISTALGWYWGRKNATPHHS